MSALQVAGVVEAGELSLDVELEVGPDETVAVLGPNGAGKTTLLRAISGLRPLTSGVVRLDGRVLDEPTSRTWVPPEDRSVGVVFQDLLLFPFLNVTDNVAFGLEAAGLGRAAARTASTTWLERFGLGDRAKDSVRDLSGGESQRVAVARALAPVPRALLLDEPLSSLDADVRATVRRQLRGHLAQHSGPCIVVTHDPLDAAILADRVVVLEAGRITAAGSLSDLVARPRTAWAAELAGTNLLPATAIGQRLVTADGGELISADVPDPGPALVAIRPASVTLHLTHPEGSARNVWPAIVAEVEGFGDRFRIRVEGSVALVAEVTAGAVDELGLVPGRDVWASVKATDVSAYPA
ncbi:MAG: ABC transporter ATP-binding protein [Acidimicrobiales bacterium]